MNHGLRISGSQFGSALGFAVARSALTRLYDGAERPASEVAMVRSTASFVRSAKITQVDDRSLDDHEHDAEVLPGRHVARLAFTEGTAQHDTRIEFVAKAGHVYDVHACAPGMQNHELWSWITDAKDQSIVAGKRPTYG